MLQELSSVRPVERKSVRFDFMGRADWDFFTAATGSKSGYIENISESGCLLRTTETIEHRRWVRLLVREPEQDLYFTAVGRIVRREDKMEMWDEDVITLYRYGVEFVQPINALSMARVRLSGASLRQACHNLLVHDHLEGA